MVPKCWLIECNKSFLLSFAQNLYSLVNRELMLASPVVSYTRRETRGQARVKLPVRKLNRHKGLFESDPGSHVF